MASSPQTDPEHGWFMSSRADSLSMDGLRSSGNTLCHAWMAEVGMKECLWWMNTDSSSEFLLAGAVYSPFEKVAYMM